MDVPIRRVVVGLTALAWTLVACGDGGNATGAIDCASATGSFELVAVDDAFGVSCIQVEAGTKAQVTIENHDPRLHNLSVYVVEPKLPEDKAGPNLLFRSEDVGPEETLVVELPSLDPGDYFFRCDYHPGAMSGTLSVVE